MRGSARELLAVLGLACFSASAPAWARSETECRAAAAAFLPEWQAAGLPKDEIDGRLRLATVACATRDVDAATAVFMGRMNVDYYRLAQLLVGRAIGSGEYELRLRDRARKRALAQSQPGFLDQWMKGDADGDLVPDGADKCPGTADLEPTADDGCPSRYRPPGYGDDPLVHQVLDKMGVMRSAACDRAPNPELPVPLSMETVFGPGLTVTVARVTNQPAGCEVFYEVMARSRSLSWAHPSIPRHAHVVLRASESVTGDPDRVEFALDWASGTPGRQALILSRTILPPIEWQVRAVNGNGLASGWSRPLRSPN